MSHFVSISTFRKRLAALLKVRRRVYDGVTDEICDAFSGMTIEQIRQNRDMILHNDEAVVIKLRIPDKRQHLSRADGYRLVYMVMKQVPLVILLDVYPKRGPSQQLGINDKEVKRLIDEFKSEISVGTIAEHDITNHLEPII